MKEVQYKKNNNVHVRHNQVKVLNALCWVICWTGHFSLCIIFVCFFSVVGESSGVIANKRLYRHLKGYNCTLL